MIKAACFRTVISVLTRLYWDICAVRGITPWLERVDSDVNISDIPTRGDEWPFKTDSVADLSLGGQLLEMVREGIRAQTDGYFGPELFSWGVILPCLRTDRRGSRVMHFYGPLRGR